MNNRIKELRESIGLDQGEFANRIGVKQPTISGYESGIRKPSDAIIKAICREFHVREEWIRDGTGEMEILPVEHIMNPIENLIADPEDEFNRLIIYILKCYDSFDENGKNVLREFARKLKEEQEKDQV